MQLLTASKHLPGLTAGTYGKCKYTVHSAVARLIQVTTSTSGFCLWILVRRVISSRDIGSSWKLKARKMADPLKERKFCVDSSFFMESSTEQPLAASKMASKSKNFGWWGHTFLCFETQSFLNGNGLAIPFWKAPKLYFLWYFIKCSKILDLDNVGLQVASEAGDKNFI